MRRNHAPYALLPVIGPRVGMGLVYGMPAAHRHGDLELNYVLEGHMSYLFGPKLITLPHHRLVAIWASSSHQGLRPAETVRLVVATIPLETALQWRLPPAFIKRLMRQGILVDPQAAEDDALRFNQWLRDSASGALESRQIMLLEMHARLRRMAIHMSRRRPAPVPDRVAAPSAALEVIRRMAGFIATHYREDLRMEQVAATVDLHPHYAMGLFRKHTGSTLNQFLTRQRIAEAQRLLLTTRQPILDIAANCGFGSLSRFYEAFAAHAGCTPRHYRNRGRILP